MISSQYGFIFIHYPKTGGTSVQTILLPYSDDKKSLQNFQDGVEMFEVVGSLTPEKHATLQDYWDRLSDKIFDFQIAIAIRHPFERIVSAYFSPHKWLKRNWLGKYVAVTPFWDPGRFETLLQIRYQRSAVDYLTVNGQITKPDFVIRYETLRTDFEKFLQHVNIPIEEGALLPHVNATAASSELKLELLNNKALRDQVENIYRQDMEFFGYDTYEIS